MKKDFLVAIVLAVLLGTLFAIRPFYGWWLRDLFKPSIGPGPSVDLRLENDALKAEIAKLSIAKSQTPAATGSYIQAMVYSQYPFNFKNELTVDAGSREGVVVGHPALFGPIVIGRVERVFEDTSIIQTVFDGGFQISAGVGSQGVKALFTGGSSPILSLMPLIGSVKEGDSVYSISPDIPYGTPIGEIESIRVSKDHLFREAVVKFSYDLSEVKTVLIKK